MIILGYDIPKIEKRKKRNVNTTTMAQNHTDAILGLAEAFGPDNPDVIKQMAFEARSGTPQEVENVLTIYRAFARVLADTDVIQASDGLPPLDYIQILKQVLIKETGVPPEFLE